MCFALKGQGSIAQGNALGTGNRNLSFPLSRRRRWRERGKGGGFFIPRALPWATIHNPFGVKSAPKNSLYNAVDKG